MYIVSACLLGEPCRYDGKDNLTDWVKELTEDHTVCMVCPETLGKLSVPRPKSEIKDGAVINEEGEDVTKAFEDEEIEGAILKSNSPSCGKDKVYDGTFTGTLVDGEGIFAKTLREHGIKIYTEKEKF